MCCCAFSPVATSNQQPATSNQQPSDRNRIGLEIAKGSLDFGTVWSSSAFEWTLPLKNVSRDQILVSSVSTSCGCTVVAGDSEFSIKPSTVRDVALVIDLNRDVVPSLEPRQFSVTVNVASRSGVASWSLSGQVRDAFEKTSSSKIELTTVDGVNEGADLDVEFRQLADLSNVTAELIGLPGQLSVTGSANMMQTVMLEVAPLDEPGNRNGLLRLSGLDEAGKKATGEWPVVCKCLPALYLSPAFSHLGILNAGESKTLQFQVASRTGHQLLGLTSKVVAQAGIAVEASVDGERLNLVVKPEAKGEMKFDVHLDGITKSTSRGNESHQRKAIVPFTAIVI